MTDQEKNTPTLPVPCKCPFCVIERFYLEAAARKLDAEIMGMASDVLMEGGNETVWVNCRGSTPECV